MSRPSRTVHEDHALDRLTAHLASTGSTVAVSPDVTDAPDAELTVDGEVVAVEFSLIGVQQVFAWYHRRRSLELDKQYKIRVPNEPHMWCARVLEKKRLHDYRAGRDQSWLVVYTEAPHRTDVSR